MIKNIPYTDFLPAERSSQKEIFMEYQEIESSINLRKIIDAVTVIAIIINHHRQIVYANKQLYEAIGTDNLEDILGLRPGEILKCVHATETDGGCGTTKACRVCGAVLCIKKCMEDHVSAKEECRVTTKSNGEIISLDLLVSASPVIIGKHNYAVISITDISNEKRKRILEKIFFHDIINIAGGLKGLVDFLKIANNLLEKKDLLKMIEVSVVNLCEEIASQQALIEAENGDLQTVFKVEDSLDIINQVITAIAKHDVAWKKNIVISEESKNILFTTDITILRRVLTNLLKNALEASSDDETITISCTSSDNYVKFSVHNNDVIPEDIKYQIFQRSFSTKGANRGIGTYSIRLLTERYLKGMVSFTSDEDQGTIFTIRLPFQPPEKVL